MEQDDLLIAFEITQMEAVAKTKQYQSQRQRVRQGDWVCIYCQNYNYAFRSICNRCRLQTKQRNFVQAAQLNSVYSKQPVGEWHFRQDMQNEDPMEDDHFPKVLFVTPPKSYLRGLSTLKQLNQGEPSSKNMGLRERDPNQKKTQSKTRLDTFQKENLKWLNKIIEE